MGDNIGVEIGTGIIDNDDRMSVDDVGIISNARVGVAVRIIRNVGVVAVVNFVFSVGVSFWVFGGLFPQEFCSVTIVILITVVILCRWLTS